MRTTDGELDIWDRWAPFGGIVFVIALVVATILYFSGGSPAHDTPSSVTSFIRAHRTALEASWWFLVVGQFAVLVYIMGIVMVFRRATSTWAVAHLVVLGAGVISLAVSLVEDGAAFTALYFTATKTSGDVTHALYTAGNTTISNMEATAVGVTILAASSLILTTRAFPRWLGWVGIADAVPTIVGSTVGAVVDVVSLAGTVGGILSLVFVAGTSVSMLGTRGLADRRVTAAANP